jgi:tRNA threonylcarbamoyladenosine dehydratase
MTSLPLTNDADLERRFGGLRRLYGNTAYDRIRALRVAVVGVGGVGSWVAEALARSGVAGLMLIDLDHVAESNINRQVQALSTTLGQAKVQALRERIAHIHPGCKVTTVEEFVSEENCAALLGQQPVHVVVDACDQVRAKAAVAAWCLAQHTAAVLVGAAGGKCQPQAVQVQDLAQVTHDPLLAALRQRLRQHHAAPRSGSMGLACVFSNEAVRRPEPIGNPQPQQVESNLNCHGYGSSVAVTATFGMVAASLALQSCASAPHFVLHP